MTTFRQKFFLIHRTIKNLFLNSVLVAALLLSFLMIPSIQVNAQATADTNIFGSVGFRECTFTDTIRTGGDVDEVASGGTLTVAQNQFQQCIQTIFRFFFVIAIFLIAIRIAVEAFASINPMIGGKAIDNSVGLIRDVTIGLILIGSPSLFLSFLNPATLSIQQLINLNGIGPGQGTTTGSGSVNSTTPASSPRITTLRIGDRELSPDDINKIMANPEAQEARDLMKNIIRTVTTTSTPIPQEIREVIGIASNKYSSEDFKSLVNEANNVTAGERGTINNLTLFDRYQVVGRQKDTQGTEAIKLKCVPDTGLANKNTNFYNYENDCNKTILVQASEAQKCRPFLDRISITGKIGCNVIVWEQN